MCALQAPPATEEDRRALVRTFAWTAGIVAGVGALLIGLVVATVMMGGAPWPRPVHYAMLVPMALPIALPIAMTFGLAIGFGGRAATRHAKRTIVATAFVASLVSLGSLWTITPLANQAFRQATFEAKGGRGNVMKGAAEMTMPELRRQANAPPRSARQAELARMIPGRALHRLAARTCCAKTLERIVEPAIADLQKEYAQNRTSCAELSRTGCGYAAVIKVIGMCALSVSLVTADDERAKCSPGFSCGRSAVSSQLPRCCLYRLAESQPVNLELARGGHAHPAGGAVGDSHRDCLRHRTWTHDSTQHECRKGDAVWRARCVSIEPGGSCLGHARGNQAFRQIAIDESRARGYDGPVRLQKGYNEMRLSELRRQAELLAADGETSLARLFVFRFHFRLSFAAAAFALASLLIAASVNHRGLRFVTAFAACCAYWMLMYAGDAGSRQGYLPPPLGAWLPNLVMIASAIFFIASSSSSGLRGSPRPAQ